MKMNVLHIINGEHYSGAERVQDLLAMKLPDLGCNVYLGCLKPGIFADKCFCSKSIIHNFPMDSKINIYPAFQISRFIKRSSIDIIHTHTPRAVLIGSVASRLSGCPMVHHVHSPSLAETNDKTRNLKLYYIEKVCMSRAHQLLPVSNSLKVYLRNLGYNESKISVIHNGVPSVYPFVDKSTPVDDFVLGMVALFRPRKGLEILLESVAQLIRHYKFKIRLVGPFESEEYLKSIRDYAASILPPDSVKYVGFVSDVNSELRKMDAMVLPSLFGEGLPMVVLESMAIGTPVIATAVEGVPEAIENGKSGILATPGDARSLAEAIISLASGAVDYQSLRCEAHQRHFDFFSAQKMAENVYGVYQQVLNR